MKTFLCVGLDPSLERLPKCLKDRKNIIYEFNKSIIDSTFEYVCAYKPQIAHYSAISAENDLELTINYIRDKYPSIPVILDAKRGDIGSTAEMYAKEAFDRYNVDAVTVNPFLGFDSIKPFVERKDKGIIVLCKTSNPTSSEIQDQTIDGKPLFLDLAERAVKEWNYNNNILFVVGATYPSQMKNIREIAPENTFLIPGIGTQGGSIKKVLENGLRSDGLGVIISASRSIIYASDKDNYYEYSAKIAKKYKLEIEKYWKAK
ncbi:MAG: orotidine-5'-phosphate decarboxylase [Deltaproteobacteria bacterium]|nr:orotidine-5'-phosphate decarboxylase [Deltaproteobacteria bacterium]